MPQLDNEQKKVVRAIRREAQTIRNPKLRRIFTNAAVQTGLVEYNLHNRAGGDLDSSNWRQERASIYGDEWARTGGPLNLRASVRRFKNEFLQQYDPGERSYEVAAQVQRPREDLRGRYQDVAGDAAQILRQVGGSPQGPASGPASTQGPARPDRYRTIPGVDNSALRQQAMFSYLDERGKPGALLELKSALDNNQDVPSRSVRIPGSNSNRTNATDSAGNPGRNRGGETTILRLLKDAERFGLTIREHPRYDHVDPVHADGSYHYQDATRGGRVISHGAAADLSGDPKQLAAFKRYVRRKYGRDLEELIYNAGGGANLKDGRKVGSGFYSGHTDHLHIADDD